jgi:hypothetical protein
MRTVIAFLIVISSFGARAATSPECVSPTAANQTTQQNWTLGVKLCTPTKDVDGVALAADELTFCTLHIGLTITYRFAALIGYYAVIPADATWPKQASVWGDCEGGGGTGPASPTYDARLRKGKPAPPWFMP